MDELEKLNVAIRDLEQELLASKVDYNEDMMQAELIKTYFKNELDPKNKEFSNDEKREVFAMAQPNIKGNFEALKARKLSIDLKEVRLRYLQRLFQIQLAGVKHEI